MALAAPRGFTVTQRIGGYSGRASRGALCSLLASCFLVGSPADSLASPFAFQAQPSIPIGATFVASIAVGDFDRNDKPDLAVAHYAGVSVILGNGDGSFQSPVAYPITGYVESVAAADFNRDGKSDLVVSSLVGSANGPINSVSVLLGNGNGAFQSPIVYAVVSPPDRSGIGALAVGDFNEDGIPDVSVIINAPYDALFPYSFVLVLYGNGDGTLGSPLIFPAGGGAREITIGDFNRDGTTDLAVANFGCGNAHCAGSTVSVLLGNGDGSFGQAVGYPTSGSPVSIAVGDVNGDAVDEIAVAAVTFKDAMPYTYDVSLLLGVDDGTFVPAVPSPVTYRPRAITVADFDRDGKPDVAVVGTPDGSTPGSLNGVAVLRGDGDGTFQPPAYFPLDQTNGGYAIALGDFNHDDKPDIALVDLTGNAQGNVVVLINLSGDRLFFDGFEGP